MGTALTKKHVRQTVMVLIICVLIVIYVLPHTVLTVMFELWDGIYGAKIDAMVLKQVITSAKRSDNSA